MIARITGFVLVVMLIASAVFNLWASVRYFFTLRELYRLHAWEQHITSTINVANALGTEVVAYARQHPNMEPVLQHFYQKPKLEATSAPAPASAPVAPAPKPTR